MTTDEEASLWHAEMAANRTRYALWLKQRRRSAPESEAIVRARELIRRAKELVAESRGLRSGNR